MAILRRSVVAILVALMLLTGLMSRPTGTAAHESFGPLHRYLYYVVFPDEPGVAAWFDAIIECESAWDAGAWNPTPIYNGEHATGLLQFIPSTFYGVSDGYIWNPYDQMWAARTMWEQGRMYEWACA